jgi:hypothetical protein
MKPQLTDAELTKIFTNILIEITPRMIDAIIEPLLTESQKSGVKKFKLNDETSKRLNEGLWKKLDTLWRNLGMKPEDSPWVAEMNMESSLWKTYDKFWNDVWIIRKKEIALKLGLIVEE